MRPLADAVARTDLPLSQFYPTHVNRQPHLLNQAAELCRKGVPVDVTASATPELDATDAVRPGMDADFILFDDDLRLRAVIAGGRVAARDGKPLLHGPFQARARAGARRQAP